MDLFDAAANLAFPALVTVFILVRLEKSMQRVEEALVKMSEAIIKMETLHNK